MPKKLKITFFILVLFLGGLSLFGQMFYALELSLWNSKIVEFKPGQIQSLALPGLRLELENAHFSPPDCKPVRVRAFAPQVTLKFNNASAAPIPIKVRNLMPGSTISGTSDWSWESPTSLGLNLAPRSQGAITIAPAGLKPDFSFMVFGDAHTGWIAETKVLQEIVTAANRRKVDFIIVTGDLVVSGKPQDFERFEAYMQKARMPVYTVIGNHDTWDSGRSLYAEKFGPFYYAFKFNDILFTFLDTSAGTLYSSEQVWLSQLLRHDDSKVRWLFAHIPPYDPRPWGHHGFYHQPEASSFMQFLDLHRYRLSFFGHVHGYYQYVKNAMPVFITGGGGAPLIGNPGTHGFHHALLVRCHKQQAEVTVLPMGGHKAFSLARLGNYIIEPSSWFLYQHKFLRVGIMLCSGVILAYLLILSKAPKRKNHIKVE